MQQFIRFTRFILVAAVVAGGVFLGGSVVAQAQDIPPLTDAQREKIIANCTPIKSNLNQLHASDALLRVNRGQVYESLASRLMERFNDRLGSNGLDNKSMTTVTGSYRTQLSSFRSNYISYEQKLAAALAIDCTKRPDDLHKAIEEARVLRAKVHADVQKLHQYIDDYRLTVGDFLLNYERLSR